MKTSIKKQLSAIEVIRADFKSTQLIQHSYETLNMAINDLDEASAWKADLSRREDFKTALKALKIAMEQLESLGAKEEV